MAENPKKEDFISQMHFGVPIYEKFLPRYLTMKDSVVEHINDLRQQDQGIRRSNQGGWHSKGNFHQTEHPESQWLIKRLYEISTACVRDFEEDRKFQHLLMREAWININQNGEWNAPHIHLPSQWSGVFYVDAGQPVVDDPDVYEGMILFFDPLPLGAEWKRPPTITFKPQTGHMLLFPSFLNHMVAPYFGKSPRISLAFNFEVVRQPIQAPGTPE